MKNLKMEKDKDDQRCFSKPSAGKGIFRPSKGGLMKSNLKISWLVLVLLLALVLVTGCPKNVTSPQTAEKAPASPVVFEGRWKISDYSINDSHQKDYIGFAVDITKNGEFYDVTGLFIDNCFSHVRLTGSGRTIKGAYMPDLNDLKTWFPTMPETVLAQAYGKVKYTCSMTISKDGQTINAMSDNITIYRRDNSFSHYERLPGFWKYTLTR